MEIFDVLLNIGLVTTALVSYLIFFRRSTPAKLKGHYREPAWNYPLRLLSARIAVKRWKSKMRKSKLDDMPRTAQTEGWDCITIRASSSDGAMVFLAIRKFCNKQPLAEVTVHIKLADGTTYKLPETAVAAWQDVAESWSAAGLKIQVLQPETRLRVMYNGLLTRVKDGATRHVRFNFIWASASGAFRHPEDWSDALAAQALALEPWRDDRWPYTLGKYGDGSWLQWGALQGRLQAYDRDGAVEQTAYLETRGVRERSWSPRGYQGLRRAVTITAAAQDGTAVYLRSFSYKDVLTAGYSGCVRFPDCSVQSITGTSLVLADFCEDPDGIPQAYTIHISTKSAELMLVVRPQSDGRRPLAGAAPRREVVLRALVASIRGERATGLLELTYQHSADVGPPVHVPPAPSLRWLSERDVGAVGYCVPLEARAAACPGLVGGKGASLALLASVQADQGYRVPPGFCLTTRALEKHLETNPALVAAIKEIEEATEDYDEINFKEKCSSAYDLFVNTEIEGEVREEILAHLDALVKKANEEDLGPDLRFAVRSSALGEDSEALSAAGQNDTVLGCAAAGVLRAAGRCWGSMFAFTSAHYRRINGQPCNCGGGVVVQVLVRPRAAGVLFTRHPAAGDPARLLLTANYGLGESVVSGSVEPDTITVTRGEELTVTSIELGSKSARVTAGGADGVRAEPVPAAERAAPCLTVREALRLAAAGDAQERLWGAPRDVEWALVGDEIFLLQARPITALERWSEEELLHELDYPVMADDELITFANTGEVLPRPLSALSHDLVYEPLWRGINALMPGTSDDGHDKSVVVTHGRVAIALYNSLYQRVPKKANVAIHVLEMAVYGHKVATENIISTSLHRRPHSWKSRMIMQANSFKFLWSAKSSMKDIIRVVNQMSFDTESNDPLTLLDELAGVFETMERCSRDHANTTSAGTVSQVIAMMVLLEGAPDFTSEQCREMNTLLSSGGVLSAEVPQVLASLAQALEDSGSAEEFRAQDPKRAMHWLSLNLPTVHRAVSDFLDHHGHRAIMEFDIATKPWVLVPEELMVVLQNVRPAKGNQVSKTDAEILDSLKTPKKNITRSILRWVLPLCKRMVQYRETTKANLILAVHKVRMAARRLARVLVRRWYLPDEELIFHFRVHELRAYIINRDPALLKKATQRRQYHPSWCKLKFAEMNTGWVRPLAPRAPRVAAAGARVEGASVCSGLVVARACVITDLAEIGQLQQGDVLITHSTDIGWSPYFPLLSGVVTELGGLISHGAVIAREYGLPCIVGAADVTELFRTGDTVRLSGIDGVLERVTLSDRPAGH